MNRALAGVVLLLVTGLVYWSGLYGDFMFDDAYSIRDNNLIKIDTLSFSQLRQAALALHVDFPQNRPLAMLTFGVNHYFSGLDAFYFKLTNLVLHLLTGLVLFWFSYKLLHLLEFPQPLGETRSFWLSGMVVAWWLLHPLQVSTVLYVVQRMTVLSALFSALALLSYVHGRALLIQGRNGGWFWLVLAASVLPALAFLAKENGMLVPFLLLVIELCLLKFRAGRRWQQQTLQVLFGLCVVLPAIFVVFWLMTHWAEMAATYVNRSFTLEERLLTQARILWFYLRLILLPTPTAMGFFHDDIAISTGLFTPLTTALSLLGWVIVPAVLFYLRDKLPLLLFGLCFFLVGHALESSFIALELVFEHRNYLPSFGIMLAAVGIFGDGRLFSEKPRMRVALALSLLLFMALMSGIRSYAWGNSIRLYVHEAANHPDSLRANFKLGSILTSLVEQTPDVTHKAEYYQEARRTFEHITALNPDYSDGLFGLIVLNLNAGKPVPGAWVQELAKRLEFSLFNAQNVTVMQFSFLVQCQMAGSCPLRRSDLETIFSAALRNKTLPYTGKAAIANAYRAYYANVIKDMDTALLYGRQAADAWPDWVIYRIRLVELYLQRREPERAAAELAKAHALDGSGRFAQALGEADALLAQAYGSTPANPAPISGGDAGTSGR